MPHVIYLHGALTQGRYVRNDGAERLALLRSQRIDVVSAMTVAGVINLSMLVVAAQVLAALVRFRWTRSRAPTRGSR